MVFLQRLPTVVSRWHLRHLFGAQLEDAQGRLCHTTGAIRRYDPPPR